MSEYQVEWVTLSGGKSVPAEKLVCPVCEALDIHTDIDTSTEPAKAICSRGHEWTFKIGADA